MLLIYIVVIFLCITHERHPLARPQGRGMVVWGVFHECKSGRSFIIVFFVLCIIYHSDIWRVYSAVEPAYNMVNNNIIYQIYGCNKSRIKVRLRTHKRHSLMGSHENCWEKLPCHKEVRLWVTFLQCHHYIHFIAKRDLIITRNDFGNWYIIDTSVIFIKTWLLKSVLPMQEPRK